MGQVFILTLLAAIVAGLIIGRKRLTVQLYDAVR